MNYELQVALTRLHEKSERYYVAEALSDPDITIKRYAIEILKDLSPTKATTQLIQRIRLY